MGTSLAAVLELVDQLSEQEQAQVTEYLLAKRNANSAAVLDKQPDQAELKRRLAEWLDDLEKIEIQKPIDVSNYKQEYVEALVEKYQRKVSARDVLMSTRGSWGSRTLDEIDAELDHQRQDDWDDIK